MIKEGETSLFDILYSKYQKRIINYINKFVNDIETAEDLSQDTFIKALVHINTFNKDRGSFSGWLYRIAHNEMCNYFKKNIKKIEFIEDCQGDIIDIEFITIIDSLSKKETAYKVNEGLNLIHNKYAVIVRDRYLNHKTYKELALEHNINERTIGTYLHRGLKELAKLKVLA